MITQTLNRISLARVAALVLFILLWIAVRASSGQTTPPVSPAPPAVEQTLDASAEGGLANRSLLGIIRDGGFLMYPLFACSFVLLVFAFERSISLRTGRVIPGPFVRRFQHQIEEGQLDREQAMLVCEENGSPIAKIFAAAVRKWGRSAVEVEQAVIDAGERAASELRRYLRIFNGVATISPLLGLLGTVFGIIRAFNDIASSDAMGRMEMLSKGISEALFTTAMGLLVAIPAVVLHLYFVSRVDRLVIQIDSASQDVVQTISAEALQEASSSRRGRKAA
jgi:biopolymer transport protein ExbB